MEEFKQFLRGSGMSANTIKAYVDSIERVLASGSVDDYVDRLRVGNASTANLRIAAINKWNEYRGVPKRYKQMKVPKKTYVENVISHDDYIYFRHRLKQDGRMLYHYAVWIMCASGCRVSELLKVRAEDIQRGQFDVCSKGGKTRRIYFPSSLCADASSWMKKIGREGLVFINRYGRLITANGLARQLRDYAREYGLDSRSVHPHSFRHRFAINFLSRKNDLPLLADIMGHSSIDTTRIYLRRSAEEQRRYLDTVVDW